jgi:hypothetical protein
VVRTNEIKTGCENPIKKGEKNHRVKYFNALIGSDSPSWNPG